MSGCAEWTAPWPADPFGPRREVRPETRTTTSVDRHDRITKNRQPMTRIATPGAHPTIAWVFSFLGAIAALLLPFIESGTRQSGLERAAEMISSSVLLSRQKAVAGDTKYRIEYDHKTFRVYREESAGKWLLDPPANRFQLPRNVQIASTSTQAPGGIVIDAAGGIDGAGSPVWLRLQDGTGKRASIRISKSGRVQELTDW
jgi:hypothetical protein